jgi:hypothetical protein
MTDAASLTVSIVAAVISLGSAVAAFVALRGFPKPYLTFRSWRDDPEGFAKPTLQVQVVNLGTASALDVRLTMENMSDAGTQVLFDPMYDFFPGHHWEGRISMAHGTAQTGWDKDEYGDPHPPEGAPKDTILELALTWRQSPSMNRVRSKAYRIRIFENGLIYGREKFYVRHWLASIWIWILSPWDKLSDVPHTPKGKPLGPRKYRGKRKRRAPISRP